MYSLVLAEANLDACCLGNYFHILHFLVYFAVLKCFEADGWAFRMGIQPIKLFTSKPLGLTENLGGDQLTYLENGIKQCVCVSK